MFKAKIIKHRYLVFEVSHTVLLVDAISVGPAREILPAEGKKMLLPSLHFSSRKAAEKFLLELGASRDLLDKAGEQLDKANVALVQIID